MPDHSFEQGLPVLNNWERNQIVEVLMHNQCRDRSVECIFTGCRAVAQAVIEHSVTGRQIGDAFGSVGLPHRLREQARVDLDDLRPTRWIERPYGEPRILSDAGWAYRAVILFLLRPRLRSGTLASA